MVKQTIEIENVQWLDPNKVYVIQIEPMTASETDRLRLSKALLKYGIQAIILPFELKFAELDNMNVNLELKVKPKK
jgi:hypothetical protein